MKKRVFAALMAAVTAAGLLAGCGGGSDAGTGGAETGEEGKIINIYSWNDEFRTRLEAVYPEVESTSDDGTVTTLKDGTEIHWVINPNQDGVYQQKLDEALMNQADAAADDKIDIFLSETDYVYKYTDADADVAMPLTDLGIDPDTDLADQIQILQISMILLKQRLPIWTVSREVQHGSAAREYLYTAGISQRMCSVQMIRQQSVKKSRTGIP